MFKNGFRQGDNISPMFFMPRERENILLMNLEILAWLMACLEVFKQVHRDVKVNKT